MADSAKSISNFTSLTAPAANDILVLTDVSDLTESANGTTKNVTIGTLLGNSAANVNIQQLTPANSTITVKAGTIFYDSNYIYIATANNNLKRVALSSF